MPCFYVAVLNEAQICIGYVFSVTAPGMSVPKGVAKKYGTKALAEADAKTMGDAPGAVERGLTYMAVPA